MATGAAVAATPATWRVWCDLLPSGETQGDFAKGRRVKNYGSEIKVRLSDARRRDIEALAWRCGTSISQLVRLWILEGLKKAEEGRRGNRQTESDVEGDDE